MLGSTLHRYKENAKYLLVDTEGESLNLATTRPWQIAWAIADKNEVLSTRMAYIGWKDLDISRDSALISRFDPDVYRAAAEDARKVLEEFEALLYDPTIEVVWQNGLRYDVFSLTNWRRALGLTPDYSYLLRSIDTDVLSKCKIKKWGPDISSPAAWLSFQYRCTNWIEKGLKTNLTTMAKEEEIEHDYSTTHDALSDILLMGKLFQKRLWQVEF